MTEVAHRRDRGQDRRALGVDSAETVIVGEAVKRPGVNHVTLR
ncbi:hypothetical protein ABIA32_006619 [Streptacidiphilus sp. MAP12-20]